MRERLKTAFSALVVGILAAGNVFSAEKHECGHCHITSDKTAQLSLKAPLSALCVGCHPDRRSQNEHKVDIVPSMQVLELPLSRDGKMTCATCHDPHEKNGDPKLLRVQSQELCYKCHFR
jgi:predicted CXXCH cytochrome family protein